MKEKFIKLCKKHRFMLVAICWTPAWLFISCILGNGDVLFILMFLIMCWTGFSISALGTLLVNHLERKKKDEESKE